MYPGNLPFDANAPSQQFFIHGLPYSVPGRNPPNGFPMQLGPEAFKMLDGHLRHQLQEQAPRNPLRTFLFNQMASNMYNNQQYDELLVSAGGFLEMVLAANTHGNNVDSAAAMVAQKMTGIYASINAVTYQPLQQLVQDPNIVNSVNSTLGEFEQIKQQILQFQQRNQQPAWGGNQGGYNQGGYGGGDNYQPRQTQWQGGTQMGFNQPNTFNGNGGNMRGMFNTPQPNQHRSVLDTGRRGGLHDYQEVDVGKTAPTNDNAVKTSWSTGSENRRSAAWDIPDVKTADTVSFDNDTTPAYEAPLFYNDLPDHMALKPLLPFNLTYNPNTHERIYLPHKDGYLVEVIQEKGEFMDYEQHELDAALKTQSLGAPSGSVQGDGWKDYHYINATATILDDETEEGEVTPAVQFTNLIDAHSDQQAEFYLRQALNSKRIKIPEDAILEFQYRHLKPIAYRIDRKGADDLAKAETMDQFISVMSNLDMPERFCGQITKRAIGMINDALNYSMSVSWTIDELSDYAELLTEIANEHGESVRKLFADKINDLIPLLFSAVSAPEVSNYLKETYKADRLKDNIVEVAEDTELSGFFENVEDPDTLDLTTEDYAVVFLTDVISITQVPWTLKSMELKVDKDQPIASVKQSVNPVEFKVLQDLYARTKDLHVRHYFIDTIDGYRLKVLPGWLSKDYYALGLWRE